MRTADVFYSASIFMLLATAPLLRADSQDWVNTGTNPNWSSSSNWSGGVPPGATSGTTSPDIATFNSTTGSVGTIANPIIIDEAGLNLGGIRFDTAAGSYHLGTAAGHPITLSSGGALHILASINSGNNPVETIHAPLILGGDYTFTVGNNSLGRGSFNIEGSISGGASGDIILTLSGANHPTGSTNNFIRGAITDGDSSALGILKSGPRLWDLAGANAYSGATMVNEGTLKITGSNTGGGAYAVTNGAFFHLETPDAISASGLALEGGAIAHLVQGLVELGAGGITSSSTGTLRLFGASIKSTAPLAVSANVATQLTGASSIDTAGGDITFNSKLVQTGNSTPNASRLTVMGGRVLRASAGLGPGAGVSYNSITLTGADTRWLLNAESIPSALVVETGTMVDLNGYRLATRRLDGAGTVTNTSPSTQELQLNESANFNGSITGNVSVVVDANSGSVTLSGANTHTGDTLIKSGTILLTGSLNGSNLVTSMSSGSFTQSATSVIAGAGSTVTNNGPGSLILAGANTYSGETIANRLIKITGSNNGNGPYTVNGWTSLDINSNGAVLASGLALNGNMSALNLNAGIFCVGASGITGAAGADIKLAGGTLASSAPMSIGSGLEIYFQQGDSTIDTTGGDITSASSIGSIFNAYMPNSLTVKGGHTLKSPLNTTGPTRITGQGTRWTLNGASRVAYGPLTVDTGSTVDLNGTGTLNVDSLLLHGDSSVVLNVSSTTLADRITAGNTLTFDGSATPASPARLVLAGEAITGFDYRQTYSWTVLSGFSIAGLAGNLSLDESALLAGNETAGGSFSLITAAKTITLRYTPTPYSAWRFTHSLPLDSSATANADGDALSDLLEYALGSSPVNQNEAAAIPVNVDSSGHLTLSFNRLKAELVYTVETSSDLVNWTPIAINPGEVGDAVTVTDTMTAHPKRFIRLRVTL